MQARLVSEFGKGRTLLVDSDVASSDPRVHTSPFAMVPKKNVDYAEDGRIIHDLSAPKGRAVNEFVVGDKLDASTGRYEAFGRPILSCYRRFPRTVIFGMTADVDSAFQNVPASAAGSLPLAGRVPGTNLVAIALAAVFGFTDSPGLFGFFARAAKHYHSLGFSAVADTIEQLHSWLWVDDFVFIEPSSFHLLFGSPGWNDAKSSTWSTNMHAVGLNWDLDRACSRPVPPFPWFPVLSPECPVTAPWSASVRGFPVVRVHFILTNPITGSVPAIGSSLAPRLAHGV